MRHFIHISSFLHFFITTYSLPGVSQEHVFMSVKKRLKEDEIGVLLFEILFYTNFIEKLFTMR